MYILIGTLIYRSGAYVLDKFLANQQEIHLRYPASELIMATAEVDYLEELESVIRRRNLRGKVIYFDVEKPAYSKSRLWNIACGREAIRHYLLTNTDAGALLYLDADMTFNPEVISIMKHEMPGYGAVFSGYRFKNNRIGLAGAGCLLLTREALERIQFRCYEFRNGQVINEDNILEMDLYGRGVRIKKSFFLEIDHHVSDTEYKRMHPQRIRLFRKIANHSLVRYWLMKASIKYHLNIPDKGQRALWRSLSFFDKLPGAGR